MRNASASSAILITGTGGFIPMRLLGASGVWEIFVPGVGVGAHYKFEIRDAHGKISLKTDPYGFFFEVPPKNAAIVWDTRKFKWTDDAWMKRRREPRSAPLAGEHLRGASRFLAEKIRLSESLELPRTRRAAGRIRQAHGFHPRRIFAAGGTRLLSVVGLSSDRFLRAHEPLRHAGRFPVSRQRPA